MTEHERRSRRSCHGRKKGEKGKSGLGTQGEIRAGTTAADFASAGQLVQIAQLTAHVMAEIFARLGWTEAVGEFVVELAQRGAERGNLIRCHP